VESHHQGERVCRGRHHGQLQVQVQGDRGTTAGSPRNFVQAYLSELTLQQVKDLRKEVQAALDDLMDTNRLMSVYFRDGPHNDIDGCFRRNLDVPKNHYFTAKGPYRYKPTDENRVLHQRLAIHNRHFIPIGFYYAKWLEKLSFYLNTRGGDDGQVIVVQPLFRSVKVLTEGKGQRYSRF
jgi:hypothetical protein